LALLREAGHRPIRLGVIRAVTTRHGPGPFPTEDANVAVAWEEPHNVDGPWQGSFRMGHLDLVAHNYAMRVCGGVDEVAVTHLDLPRQWVHDGRKLGWQYCDAYAEMPRIPIGRRGDLDSQQRLTTRLMGVTPWLHEADEDELLAAIQAQLDAPVTLGSYGPTAEDKRVLAEIPVPVGWDA
jgi:adenylosuccinate synthase